MKTKFPRAAAIEVARFIVKQLTPACERLVVAGSLRRMKEEVGDVEILYIPKFVEEPDGLFDTKRVNQVDVVLQSLFGNGVIGKRLNLMGSATWGPRNKYAVHSQSGIPVDFFETGLEAWFSYLVCRTGSAESNTRIASAAQAKGWKWHPYAGFSDWESNLVFPKSEEEVFAMVGLPYLEPKDR